MSNQEPISKKIEVAMMVWTIGAKNVKVFMTTEYGEEIERKTIIKKIKTDGPTNARLGMRRDGSGKWF